MGPICYGYRVSQVSSAPGLPGGWRSSRVLVRMCGGRRSRQRPGSRCQSSRGHVISRKGARFAKPLCWNTTGTLWRCGLVLADGSRPGGVSHKGPSKRFDGIGSNRQKSKSREISIVDLWTPGLGIAARPGHGGKLWPRVINWIARLGKSASGSTGRFLIVPS